MIFDVEDLGLGLSFLYCSRFGGLEVTGRRMAGRVSEDVARAYEWLQKVGFSNMFFFYV